MQILDFGQRRSEGCDMLLFPLNQHSPSPCSQAEHCKASQRCELSVDFCINVIFLGHFCKASAAFADCSE